MSSARARRPPPDPRQIQLFDLGSSVTLVRALVANDVALAQQARMRRAAPKWAEPGSASRQLELFGWVQERPYVIGQVYSLCQILRAVGGDPTSGQQRLRLGREIDALVLRYFEQQWEDHGEEHAVLMTWSLISNAPTFRLPEWFEEYAVEWKAELHEAFAGQGGSSIFPDWDV